MNKLLVLLKRESQEHRTTLFYLPAIIFAFSVVLMFSALVIVEVNPEGIVSIQVTNEYDDGAREYQEVMLSALWGKRLQQLADMSPSRREQKLNDVYFGFASVFFVTLWFVVFFYLIGSLYDDRRDRSILFWKSMPVSDSLTVASKLIVATIIAPAAYIVAVMVTHVAVLLISSLAALSQPVDVWETLWAQANIVTRWFKIIGFYLLNGLWALPFYAWLLIVSSWAKSVPLVWVIGVPIAFTLMDKLVIPGDWLSHWMASHAMPFSTGRDHNTIDVMMYLERLMSIDFAISLVFAGAVIYGAILFRGRADEI